jgi:ribulose kinase
MTELGAYELIPLDVEIAARARRALDQHTSIPATVGVHVGAGVAWLTGTASCRAERTEAEQVVRRVAGVSRVVNQILVERPPREAVIDERTAHHHAAEAVW